MRTHFLRAGAAGLSTALLLGACSSAEKAQSSGKSGSGGATSTTSAATTSATTSTLTISSSSTGTGGAGGQDAGADAPPFNPGMFDCQGCSCDGSTHYCLVVHGGAPHPGPPGPPCPDDAGAVGCIALPQACAAQPSCTCVGAGQPACTCTQAQGGVSVTCNYP